jgi:hypothetical protein
MGVLGDDAFRWESDDHNRENLGWDDVALGVDELGAGEFDREDKGWDPDA